MRGEAFGGVFLITGFLPLGSPNWPMVRTGSFLASEYALVEIYGGDEQERLVEA